jgi:predicted ATPase/DNA-binding CsgD family transcriptional regulator
VLPLRHSLPQPAHGLVGRASEAAQILAHLRDPACRLVTITGPGGVGKTHLALEVARALAPEDAPATPFRAGVFLVQLAPVDPAGASPGHLAAVVADALGLDRGGDLAGPGYLAAAIRDRPMLALLDNCEHLPGLPAFVAELLMDAPELTLLATSRGRLDLRGEWVVDLQGLPAPPEHERLGDADARYESVALFIASARAIARDFRYTAAVAPAVAQICRQVAGLPLGIELAASWAHILSCEEIAGEIAQNLDFLAAELHDLPARQQSLRAVFSSSWALLAADEQRAARRLAYFQGGFTREAAAAVAGAGLPVLSALAKKSLLRRVAAAAGGTRYALIGHIRPFAVEQLEAAGEAAATAAAHAGHYLGWLSALPAALRGPQQQEALDALDRELADVRRAWRWAIQAGPAAAVGAAAEGLYLFCIMRSRFQEGAELLLAAAGALDAQADGLALGRILGRAGWCTFQLGRHQEAREQIARSLELLRGAGASAELATPINALASLERHVGDYPAALAQAQAGYALSAAANDRYGMAVTTTTLSQTLYALGRYDEAQRFAEQSMAIERGIGNRWGSVFNLITLGQIARARGELQAACGYFQEALTIRMQLNDRRGIALCLNELGDTAVAMRDRMVAGWCYEQSLDLFRASGNLWGEIATLCRLGELAQAGDRPDAARRLYQEAVDRAAMIGVAHDQGAARTARARLDSLGGPDTPWAPVSLRRAIVEATAIPSDPSVATARAAPPGRAPGLDLTAREAEVLRLVATGLTDAQVAERLVLSTRTVSSYLSSIYGKLNVRSRSAATRLAIERGLG